ncbi:MAG: pentapeptide repeat-containing protein [Actinomadura sp.]
MKEPPALPELSELPFATALVAHDGTWGHDAYDTVHFEAGTVADADGVGARFLECAFTQVTFDGGRLRGASFNDVWLREVRLVGSDLRETDWLDATVAASVIAGVQAYGSELRRVTFRGCKLDSVNLRDCTLTDVTFADCLLGDVDLRGARLTRVAFPGSRLSRVDISAATLDKVDLRGAELGLTITPESLRGAVVTTAQLLDIAPALAEGLGILVEDT